MKQDKNSIVKSIKHNYRQYPGNSGDTMCVHYITFQNGDEGELHNTSLVCSEFEQGVQADYSIEQKGFRGGKPEMRIRSNGNSQAYSNKAPQRSSNGGNG